MTCCFEVYKNVGEKPAHPLRNYWKNSFVLCKTYWCFHLTQACRSTLLNSSHDASTVSNSAKAFCLQDYEFSIGPKYNYFLTSALSYLLSVNKGNIARTCLISLCTRRKRTAFNRQSGCYEIRCSRPPEARYFRGFVRSTSYS